MYRVDRNNFYVTSKASDVMTPESVSAFLFHILHQQFNPQKDSILDPCVGTGSLLKNWRNAGFRTFGVDICPQGYPKTILGNYLEFPKNTLSKPSLVLANPPFNLESKQQEMGSKNI